jgi:hypothetical protein
MWRSPTGCGLSACDCKASIMRKPWPTGGCCATEEERRVCCGVNCFYSVNNFISDVFVVGNVENPIDNNNISQRYACRNQNTAVVNLKSLTNNKANLPYFRMLCVNYYHCNIFGSRTHKQPISFIHTV